MDNPNRNWAGRQSYSQWVRSALDRARTHQGAIYSLFGSSVPEPRELLRSTIADAVQPQFSRYFTSAFGDGNPFVLDALGRFYGVGSEQILSTTGATGGLSLIYRALARPGDHVLIETPGFDIFHDLAEGQGLLAESFSRSGDGFSIDLDQIESLMLPDTRLIVVSNLHNPSGMAIPHATMTALAAFAERKGVLVVVDEVYGDYASADIRPCPAFALSPNLISVSSLTKIYGLGQLRCGWIVGAGDVIATLRDLNTRIEFGVSTLSHAIGAHVLANRAAFDDHSAAMVAQSRPIFDQWYSAMRAEGLVDGRLPDDGCICFPQLPGIADTEAFSEWLCERSGVIVAPGEYFGQSGHIRIGFTQPLELLEPGLEALAEGIRTFSRVGIRN